MVAILCGSTTKKSNLGIAYEYNEEFVKAKEAYLKAYELDPEDEEIKNHIYI